MNVRDILQDMVIHSSVPCRIDFGGTLDISTLYLPLNRTEPCTFNIALSMRTHVRLSAFDSGYMKISSKGFEPAVYGAHQAPYDHPMGLMFAICDYFDAHGVHVAIESTSPPRSALGGSSAAAVAMVAAFCELTGRTAVPDQVAWLAHHIESSVAGVPCGMQDQLAAAYGGVNLWQWKMKGGIPGFDRQPLVREPEEIKKLESALLLAYCGNPHVSKNINQQWVEGFVKGKNRPVFKKIAHITRQFSGAVQAADWVPAAEYMNMETALRLEMTPDVLDNMGQKMFDRAKDFNCGARFTGAGGGGCVWAIGRPQDISRMKTCWEELTSAIETAMVLDICIDDAGILIHD